MCQTQDAADITLIEKEYLGQFLDVPDLPIVDVALPTLDCQDTILTVTFSKAETQYIKNNILLTIIFNLKSFLIC